MGSHGPGLAAPKRTAAEGEIVMSCVVFAVVKLSCKSWSIDAACLAGICVQVVATSTGQVRAHPPVPSVCSPTLLTCACATQPKLPQRSRSVAVLPGSCRLI